MDLTDKQPNIICKLEVVDTDYDSGITSVQSSENAIPHVPTQEEIRPFLPLNAIKTEIQVTEESNTNILINGNIVGHIKRENQLYDEHHPDIKLEYEDIKIGNGYSITDGKFRRKKRKRTLSVKKKLKKNFDKDNLAVKIPRKTFEKVKCELCFKVFAYKNVLTVHQKDCTGRKISYYKMKKEKNQHESLTLSVKKMSKKNFDKDNPVVTIPRKTIEKEKCKCCFRVFTYKNVLTTHQKLCTGKKKSYYKKKKDTKQCDILTCDIQKKERKQREKLPCEICHKLFAAYHQLKKHQMVHTGERPFACSECGKTYLTKSCLKQHQWIHSGQKPHECEICHKRFTAASNLKAHKNIHEGDASLTLMCEECGRCFSTTTSLSSHMKTHANYRPHVCTICGKSFFDKKSLNGHFKIHTKVFACENCHRGFSCGSKLKRHQRTHTGEKPYVCQVCDRGFTTKSNLEVHARLHRDDKPYRCRICGRCFTQTGNLSSHVKTVHNGVKDYGEI